MKNLPKGEPKTAQRRIDGYIRVSDTRGREDTLVSPELQRTKIEGWAKLRDVEIIAWHTDLDVSGGRLNRPGLDALLARIESGETEGIALAKLDRLSRLGVPDALKLVERITGAGGTLATADGDVDLLTASGEFQLTIMLALARMERRRIAEAWTEAQAGAVGKGVYTASAVPRGYDKQDKQNGRRLIPNGDAPAIKAAYQMRGAGKSNADIRTMLDERLPLDGLWTGAMVERLFTTRVYRGELIRGKEANATAHDAIVTEQEWQMANGIAKRSSPKVNRENLLTGVIRCAACGHSMTPTYSSTNGGKDRIAVYKCRGKHRAGKCPAPSSITRAKVDAYVEDAWKQEMRGTVIEGPPDSAALENATAMVAELEGEHKALSLDLRARKAMGDDLYHEALDARSAALKGAQRELQELLSHANGDAGDVDSYDAATPEQKRLMIGASLDTVFVRRGRTRADADERCRVLWRGEGPDGLPGRGRKVEGLSPFTW